MSNIDTGGPAFPTPALIDHETGEVAIDSVPGMTLLDLFAGKALSPCIAALDELSSDGLESVLKKNGCATTHQLCSKAAYEYADAMIAEKRRREGGK